MGVDCTTNVVCNGKQHTLCSCGNPTTQGNEIVVCSEHGSVQPFEQMQRDAASFRERDGQLSIESQRLMHKKLNELWDNM